MAQLVHEPCDGVADMNVLPTGIRSEIVTPVAVSDPFLAPATAHVMLLQTSSGFGEPTLVPPRSMSVG
jgi:hypothetical protein